MLGLQPAYIPKTSLIGTLQPTDPNYWSSLENGTSTRSTLLFGFVTAILVEGFPPQILGATNLKKTGGGCFKTGEHFSEKKIQHNILLMVQKTG